MEQTTLLHLWNGTVQKRFRLEYRNRQSPSKNSNKRWYEQFEETENVHHRKADERPSVSDEDVKRVKETLTLNCSYQSLMEFLLGDRQFRYSNRKRL
ncbi:hypothetical protein AVEN_130618-1 [Araneus ventricosus]|uniref:Uncharacterized protein n=1 Tax=Araneus ventricosus TaxID=182803 RepID=A0A4Y2AAA4_ARAVE|nr:hypothetical protein AVEN_130618-1 [Araneus ventricosus]